MCSLCISRENLLWKYRFKITSSARKFKFQKLMIILFKEYIITLFYLWTHPEWDMSFGAFSLIWLYKEEYLKYFFAMKISSMISLINPKRHQIGSLIKYGILSKHLYCFSILVIRLVELIREGYRKTFIRIAQLKPLFSDVYWTKPDTYKAQLLFK